MSDALTILQDLVTLGFVILAALAAREWVRSRGRAQFYQALAVGMLALVSVSGRVATVHPALLLTDADIVALLCCGYALLLFRGIFVPLSRRIRITAGAACVIVGIAGVVVELPARGVAPTPLQSAVVLLIIVTWGACVIEPAARFWMASRGRPVVQQARLRALSLGYAGIVTLVLVAGTVGAADASAQVALQVCALATIPFLWASFSPPLWLRRLWRSGEEDELRRGMQDLLLFAPNRVVLADRALEWALRLVGGEAAFIADSDGAILAVRNMDDDRVQAVAQRSLGAGRSHLIDIDRDTTAISVPIRAEGVECQIVVLSGPFTPLFGTDEVARLEGYGTAVALGIARTRLTERLAAVEAAKTAFLNLASHELRGPLTVIRGYITMIADGDFGNFPQLENVVIPALVRQSEQMSLLVEQMIETARLEDDRLELNIAQWDLGEILAEIVEESQVLMPDRVTLALHHDIAKVSINADRDRIRMIIANLIDNAVKYSPQGGEVICGLRGAGESAFVDISDRGLGVPVDQAHRLFTRFGRIITPENAHISGTGLGLYLCRELARRHHGDITAGQRSGGGMTFTLTLPLASDAAAGGGAAALPVLDRRGPIDRRAHDGTAELAN